ncbi:hypothetical protein AB4520_00840 [Vibrio renipiscarius]|uniref:hypothetical protein n=1 Tax=Vibrio renipiscarius TaxID=1461322 RepID=UPI00354D7F93
MTVDEESHRLFSYIVSNKNVELLTTGMVVRVFKKLYSSIITEDKAGKILRNLSSVEIEMLKEVIYFSDREIESSTYESMTDDQKENAEIYFVPTNKLIEIRKNANEKYSF